MKERGPLEMKATIERLYITTYRQVINRKVIAAGCREKYLRQVDIKADVNVTGQQDDHEALLAFFAGFIKMF